MMVLLARLIATILCIAFLFFGVISFISVALGWIASLGPVVGIVAIAGMMGAVFGGVWLATWLVNNFVEYMRKRQALEDDIAREKQALESYDDFWEEEPELATNIVWPGSDDEPYTGALVPVQRKRKTTRKKIVRKTKRVSARRVRS